MILNYNSPRGDFGSVVPGFVALTTNEILEETFTKITQAEFVLDGDRKVQKYNFVVKYKMLQHFEAYPKFRFSMLIFNITKLNFTTILNYKSSI